MTKISTPAETRRRGDSRPESHVRELIGRITRLEIIAGAVIAAVMLSLILIEPDILEAPFENGWTLLFTFGGTALAAIAFAAMLWLRVPAVVRVIVLVVPFAIVNWWLISPYFVDEVVDEGFSTSISEQLDAGGETPADPAISATPEVEDESSTASAPPTTAAPAEEEPSPPPAPSGPVLLGAGQFVGLAGHSGTGDAGIFQDSDGSLLLRFENFDIENGPDLEVYLVPGADQTSLPEGSIHLGPLKGNIGDQSYALPPGTELSPGTYTVLVWCEAFSVEFVGATIDV
jgi:hypothetical protein